MQQPIERDLHPDLGAFGGLFAHTFPDEMLANIGKWVRFKEGAADGWQVQIEWFQIIGCQKNYRDDDCYRVLASTNDDFGRPASPNDIVFVDPPTEAQRAEIEQYYETKRAEWFAAEAIRQQRAADRRNSRPVQPKRRKRSKVR